MPFINQGIMLLFSLFMIGQQYYATWAYRKYAEPHTTESELLHRFNWALVFICCLALSMPFLQAKTQPLLAFIVSGVTYGFIYWTIFDIGYALSIGQSWDYLGGEAKTDQSLKSKLGRNAGKIKAAFGILMIVILNVLYQLLLK